MGIFSLKANAISTATKDSTKLKKSSFLVLPVVFLTPETNFGFGVGSVFTFRFDDKDSISRPSQIQPGFAYTLNKQILAYLPFQLFWKNGKYISFGELGYYKYNYFFFGIGNQQDPNFRELYGVDYPRIRINVLQKIKPNFYLGGRYWFEDFQTRDFETDGQLISGKIPGGNGGKTSGLGIVAWFDTRDNLFYPSKGTNIQTSFIINSKITGSDFQYPRFELDANQYFSLSNKQVLAFNFYSVFMKGEIPFNRLALLGGSKKMRGFYEGRYRDKNLLLLQAEYRVELFWRLGATAFANIGTVSNKFQNFGNQPLRSTYGAGLRFALDKENKVNLRFDVGFSRNSSGIYITFGEAF